MLINLCHSTKFFYLISSPVARRKEKKEPCEWKPCSPKQQTEGNGNKATSGSCCCHHKSSKHWPLLEVCWPFHQHLSCSPLEPPVLGAQGVILFVQSMVHSTIQIYVFPCPSHHPHEPILTVSTVTGTIPAGSVCLQERARKVIIHHRWPRHYSH